MKILSWNVNGIRAVQKKGFSEFLQKHKPDVLCVQETKAKPEQVKLEINGYHQYWNSAERKGYSGTAIFSKKEPLSVVNGIHKDEHNTEGRVITAEYDKFYLVTVYTPNAKHGLERIDYRLQWDKDFRNYVNKLQKSKPVVVCGDLNVAHKEIDLRNPKQNVGNPGFSDEERESFGKLLDSGFVDTFREFTKDPLHYTWWSYRNNCRQRNIGWRIDYFLASNNFNGYRHSFILPHVLGSDHCPVGLLLK